jgi:O-antigen/teichoic acid export membrane protein
MSSAVPPADRTPSAAADLLRYGLALAGPIGSAGSQFLLSLLLLRQLDPAAFGRFSFLLIVSQLAAGIWSALFCAPLPQVLSTSRQPDAPDPAHTMLSANMLGAVLSLLPFLLLARGVGESWASASAFAGFAAFALLRWFARALAYARGRQARVSASDMLYSIVLLAGTMFLFVYGGRGAAAYMVLLVATLAALLAFGGHFLAEQATAVGVAPLGAYRAIWREHGRWSLLGVLTSEATGNAHAYLVTVLLGPGAFAPLAASAILIRPSTVVANALTEFERSRIARAIGAGDLGQAARAVRLFQAILLLTWLGTGVAIIVLLAWNPRLIFPAGYAAHTLVIGAALWMATALMRLLRTPESALLQAGGAFLPLALTSLWSAAVSIVAVVVLLLAAPPLWSIVGIAIGEAVCAALIFRAARGWYARAAALPSTP